MSMVLRWQKLHSKLYHQPDKQPDTETLQQNVLLNEAIDLNAIYGGTEEDYIRKGRKTQKFPSSESIHMLSQLNPNLSQLNPNL